jgi:hypothetical protein
MIDFHRHVLPAWDDGAGDWTIEELVNRQEVRVK